MQRFSSPAAALAMAASLAVASGATAQTEPFAQVPTQEVEGRQIGWFVNRTLDAFTRAVETNRALVLVFGDRTSNLTIGIGDLVVPCPHINQLAGAAVFAFGSPLVDEQARRLALALKLTDYPTVSVIQPRTDKLVELYRLEGFFDAATIARDVTAAITRAGLWPQGRPQPAALPSHALAYPGKACTPQGAERLGFKIAAQATPPAPTPAPPPAQRTVASTGTGFLVGTDGHMLTNHHVVEGCGQVTARVRRYDRPMAPQVAAEPMRVLRVDKANDLALIQFERTPADLAASRRPLGFLDNAHPLPLACDQFLGFCPKPQRGQRVMTAGFPLQGTLSQINVTDGIVSSFEPIGQGSLGQPNEIIQITAPIQPGNSGGPLVNDRGEVVGVMASTITWQMIAQRHGSLPQNINFAVPIGHAMGLMKGLVAPSSLPTGGARTVDPRTAAGFLELSTFLLECRK